MGYHDAREIPNYWAYAKNFVLQDHMFEPNSPGACPSTCSWSRSGRRVHDPATTRSAARALPDQPGLAADTTRNAERQDARLRLDRPHLPAPPARVSWGYYVFAGHRARLRDDADGLRPACSRTRTRPASGTRSRTSTTVREDDQLGNIQPLSDFYTARQQRHAARGLMGRARPARSASIRPARISAGQAYVTR